GLKEAGLPPVVGIKLNEKISEAVVTSGSRRIWKIIGKAQVGRVKKKLVTVWDTKHVSMLARRYNLGPGAFLYWREE
ncbi:MAG: hypothetical protein V1754_09330, partial [Pseudomonadota bacterium]